MVMSTAWRKASTSKEPFAFRYFIRLSDARLQAVSSRNMYSEQGFEALMRAVVLHVCQQFTVVSYCMPGSPHCQVDSAMLCRSSRAPNFSTGLPSFTLRVQKS